MTTLSEAESNKRPFRNSNANGGVQHIYPEETNGVYDTTRVRHYAEDQSDMDFLEIQPEDSASHHGGAENAFFYQRMGNADVMRLDTTISRNRRSSVDAQKIVRRSNSEPRLNETELEVTDPNGNSSKSMINFPHRSSSTDDQANFNWRLATELQHRNSQSKYVQSPILEETDSALERELQTGSSFYLRPKGLFDFHSACRNGGHQFLSPDNGIKADWSRSGMVSSVATKRPEIIQREPRILERELPYFNNRSSFLRHKLSLNKKNGKKPSRTKSSSSRNPILVDGDETESASSNDRSQRNSRSNSIANPAILKTSKTFEDDHDSGIAINANVNNRSRFLEKKSIFTIAYDEVATTKIPSATDNLPT